MDYSVGGDAILGKEEGWRDGEAISIYKQMRTHTQKVSKLKYRVTTKKEHFTFFGDTKSPERV